MSELHRTPEQQIQDAKFEALVSFIDGKRLKLYLLRTQQEFADHHGITLKEVRSDEWETLFLIAYPEFAGEL